MNDHHSTATPGLPASLRHSGSSTIQADRLPQDERFPLELRAKTPPPETRRALRRQLAWRLFFWTAFVIAAKTLYSYSVVFGTLAWALGFGLGTTLFIWSYLSQWSRPWRLFATLTALVALSPTLLMTEPLYEYAYAAILIVLFADALATHLLQALSVGIGNASRRRWLRLRWQNRFSLFAHASRTVPLYPLLLVTPLAIVALHVYWNSLPVRYSALEDLYFLVASLPLLLTLVLLVEPLLAFLAATPLVAPWQGLRALGAALADWLRYNPSDNQAPGLFQSPAGGLAARRLMFVGIAGVTLIAFVELSFHYRGRFDQFGKDLSKLGEPGVLKLEPYQQAMLEKMNEEEQERYRAEVRRQRAAAYRHPLSWVNTGSWKSVERRFGIDVESKDEDEENHYTLLFHYLMAGMFFGPVVVRLLAAIPGLFLAVVFLPLFLLPAIQRVLALCGDDFRIPLSEPRPDERLWQQVTGQLNGGSAATATAQPTDRPQRNSLFLGLAAADYAPIVIPESMLAEHAHILGDSGSGKTSMGLAPLITQILAGRQASLVVLDLKGDDLALMENCRLGAAASGHRFRWFTNELQRSSYVFNPLAQRFLSQLTKYQQTDLLTSALGMQYGTDYGRGYFSDANAELLYRALSSGRPVRSFVDLAQIMSTNEPFEGMNKQLRQAGSHLAAVLTRIASTDALNPDERLTPRQREAAIDMQQPFEQPEVLYFHLPSSIGAATSAEIARMAMYSLLAASKFVAGERRQVFLVIDEFQRIVSNNLELFLQTARSMNIGVILANQSLSDLRKPDANLIASVRTNTRLRQVFAAGDATDLEDLVFTSGETVVHQKSHSFNLSNSLSFMPTLGNLMSTNLSETILPRLGVNELLLASDHPQQSILHIRRGDGFAQYGGFPFVLTSMFHISGEEYARRKQRPWPAASPETIVATLPEEAPPVAIATNPPADAKQPTPDIQRIIQMLDDQDSPPRSTP